MLDALELARGEFVFEYGSKGLDAELKLFIFSIFAKYVALYEKCTI